MSNGTITMTGAEYDALADRIAALEAENAKLRAQLERQPEGEEIAWSLRSDVAGCGLVRYMTDRKYQAQTPAIKQWYEPFRCQQCSDAQRAIAELRDRLDVMTQCADNHSRMFEESAEELDAAREILAQQGRRNTDLRAERDTLRQQLAERDAEIERFIEQSENYKGQFAELHAARNLLSRLSRAGFDTKDAAESVIGMRQQRDKLAGLLREVRVIVAREVERWTRAAAILPVNANFEAGLLTRIDAALAEVKPCQESPAPTT